MPPWFKKRFGKSETPPRVSSDTSPNGVYSGLRHQALSTSRAAIEIPAPSSEAPAWGVLMETGYDAVTLSLFVLSDGTTSLYFSNGGGVIGGQEHEAVRRANRDFINQANHSLEHLRASEAFPIPEAGHTIFYLLTDSGILTEGAPEKDLGQGKHPLSALFHAGHEVIGRLRLISESSGEDE